MLEIKYEMPELKDLAGGLAFGDCSPTGTGADGAGCTNGNTATNDGGAGCVDGTGATGVGGLEECSTGAGAA